jgi:sec-independent protein translocase protein TatA
MGCMHLGTGELLVLGVVLVIIFSASRMSALGNALGSFIHSFRKASGGTGFVDGKVTGKKLGDPGIEDAQLVDPKDKKPR